MSVRQRRLLMTLVLAGMVAVSAIAAPSASAIIKSLPNGQAVSYQPLRSAPRSAPSGLIPFDLAFDNMDYNGGPVMPSNTDYMLMWSPSGLGAYPDGYVSGLSRYFTDLAHCVIECDLSVAAPPYCPAEDRLIEADRALDVESRDLDVADLPGDQGRGHCSPPFCLRGVAATLTVRGFPDSM